ncbi:putative metabolite transport protein YwtG [Colletotrichum sp. SAR 10_77]|nr:putative metabolite transport protein YwtG [Colletotrichum sp. SAR 10_77]
MPPSKVDTESPPADDFHTGTRTSGSDSPPDKAARASTAALLRNPLVGLSHDELIQDVDTFTDKYGLTEYREEFRKGALVAQASNRPDGFETITALNEEEKVVLRREINHRWDQPFMLYFLCSLCAGSAIVQGMDQTAVNGAQEFYYETFGIDDPLMRGLINGDLEFLGENTQWRWMLGSTSLPPLIVMCQVYFCPESPRWYMEKGKYAKAFTSVRRLRKHVIQATRDMYYAHKLLEVETQARSGRNWKEFFTVRRNRRAATFSYFVMFMQQFCGINVVMYYSTAIFQEGGFTRSEALLTSMGMGLINWLFALPAFYTIDTFGRRNLLLVTFPLMSLSLIFTGFSFYIPEGTARLACIATGIYIFAAVYSPGAGPVPFTYCAEAFPLHIRDIGMSSATAVTWGFNFIISFSWPSMSEAFTPTGAFLWYACWNLFGFVVAYFFLPETKNLTLEELDSVFSVRNRDHAKYYTSKMPWYVNKYLLRRDVSPFPALYEVDDHHEHHDVQPKATVQHSESGLISGTNSEK